MLVGLWWFAISHMDTCSLREQLTPTFNYSMNPIISFTYLTYYFSIVTAVSCWGLGIVIVEVRLTSL